jgi:tRNA(Leu) C34 or U34 (ribose-2'-O)-methylase TrmL
LPAGPLFGDDLEILQELLRHAVTLLRANRQDVGLIRLPTRPALSSRNVSNTVAVALCESVRDDSEQN